VIVIGVDLGQKQDPSAVCVAEAESRSVDHRQESHYVIRHLERLPLGTPYPQVVDRIAALVLGVKLRSGALPKLFVDATGVGAPVMDLLQQREPEIGPAIAVVFTYGDRRTVKPRSGRVTLGKAHLVSHLQALLGSGRLHLPQTSEAAALARELLDYEIRVDDNAHVRFGAFKTGAHDDLVTALGLAVQAGSGQEA